MCFPIFSDLLDVDTTGVAYGNAITWNGTSWVDTATSTLKIALSDTSGTLAVNRGGTNLTSYTANQLLYASDSGTIAQIATSSLGLLTTDVSEGSNLYYTNTRARNAISNTTTGLTYTSASGILALTSGYNISLSASTTNWNTFYDTPSNRITDGTNLTWSGNTLNVNDAFLVNNADDTTTGQLTAANFIGSSVATSTLAGGLETNLLNVTSTTATSTFANGIDITNGGLKLSAIDCSGLGNGGKITTDANGNLICSADSGGAGVGASYLSDLLDVDTTGVAYGNAITWNGTSWVDTATSTLKIALSDTSGTLAVNRGGTNLTSDRKSVV